MSTLELECPDAGATQRVAAAVAAVLRPGDVVLLDGELGAGKTTFTQGLARALGVEETVTSPTFTLVRSYPTRRGFDLCHVDVYRLDRLSEIEDLGLPEILDDGAVVVVEWGERAAPVLGSQHLDVHLAIAGSGSNRRVSVVPHGGDWEERVDGLRSTFEGVAR